jgi:hypothetical protein
LEARLGYAEKRGRGDFPWRGRYLKPDGTYGSLPGYSTKEAAKNAANDEEAKIRAGTWIDPAFGAMSLAEFRKEWIQAQDLAPNTIMLYDYAWSAHIEPRWGGISLRVLSESSLKMQEWLNGITRTFAAGSMGRITSQLNGLFDTAIYLGYISRSPMPLPKKRQSRSKRIQQVTKPPRKGVVIVRDQAIGILQRMPTWADVMLCIDGLFTGERLSELLGMRQQYFTLQTPDASGATTAHSHYVIDPLVGAVHEDKTGQRYFGPPKSGAIDALEAGVAPGRCIDLAPFHAELHRAFHAALPADQDVLYHNSLGDPWEAATWRDSRWRPACDGREAVYSRGKLLHEPWAPIRAGLIPHDMKHTHKGILNDCRVHDVMQNYRLGHIDPGAPGIYSHPTVQMRAECIEAMQATWLEWDIDLGFWGVRVTPDGVDLSGLTIPLTLKSRQRPNRSPKTSPS